MEETTYTTGQISFIKRIKHIFIPLLVSLFILITFLVAFSEKIDLIIFIIFFCFHFLLIALHSLFRSKSYIYEISIRESQVILREQNFNNENEYKYQIEDLKVELKSENRQHEFVIVLKAKNRKFKINSLYNWNYFKLIELFKNLKQIKQEKIILDEKFVLDKVENKAYGFPRTIL